MACLGGPAATATPTPTLAPAPTATPTPTPTAPASPPTATARPPDGLIRVAVTGAAPHWDLHRVVSEWATLFGPGLAYSRLMRFATGPDTPLPGQHVECELCNAWRLVDATTYEFDVRPDARWQDADEFASRPVTPQDVVFSLERLREPDSPHVSLLDSVEEIVAVGNRTVRFTLRYSDPELPVKLASPYAVVLAPDSMAGVDLATGRVVGSGPWRFRARASGQVTLTAFEGYFRGGEPALRGIEFIPATDMEAGTVAMRVGNVDMAQVTEAQWERIEGDGFASVVVHRQGRGVVFGVNARKQPFDDERVRTAVFAALDPEAALAASFGIGTYGLGVPVLDSSWLPDEARLREVFGQPGEARDSLREADRLGQTMTLTVANFGEAYVAHGEALALQLRDAGIAASTDVVSRGTVSRSGVAAPRFRSVRGAAASRGHDPTRSCWACCTAVGAPNVTGAGDIELDGLIEEQAVEMDPERRGELVRRIQTLALERAWMFMPAISAERWAYSARVLDPPRAFPAGAGDWWIHTSVAE